MYVCYIPVARTMINTVTHVPALSCLKGPLLSLSSSPLSTTHQYHIKAKTPLTPLMSNNKNTQQE